ncbi:MAG: hypothetical protein Q7S14_01505 [bacterium]|nr:hypothetical protein [bacterium]
MDKRVIGVILLLVIFVVAVVAWPKPQVKQESPIKKVDLATQPEWVQKLDVTVSRGTSANGLKNVTFKVIGLPKDLVTAVNYVVQYQTTNKGSQGALSTKPIGVTGKIEFSKTIDFGTCSTKTCATHDGVTAIDLELDFTTSSGSFTWSKTLPLTP